MLKVALENVEMKPAKKANILPVAVVAALEAEVVDGTLPTFKRGYAWYKLVKIWTGMRYNDTQGIPLRTAELGDFCWRAEIHRSKTSGPGRKLKILPVFVSRDAYIEQPMWLEIGWLVWKRLGVEAGLQDRDFLLPAPNGRLDGFMRRLAPYAMASAMGQALLSELRKDEGGVKSTLLCTGLSTLYGPNTAKG